MSEKIEQFRSITMDQEIEEMQVQKFLKWGKGDIQQALNYYYLHLQKGKIKRKPKPKTGKKQNPIQQQRVQKAENIHKQQVEKIDRQPDRIVILELSGDSQENSQDAFSLLKRGSVKHKKTTDFIEKVRRTYQLPIHGKPQTQLIRNSQASVLDLDKQKYCQQFDMADCLADSFNPSKLLEISQNVSKVQEEDEFQMMKLEDFTIKHVYTNKSYSNTKQSQNKNIQTPNHIIKYDQKLEVIEKQQDSQKVEPIQQQNVKKTKKIVNNFGLRQETLIERRTTRASSKKQEIGKVETKQAKLQVVQMARNKVKKQDNIYEDTCQRPSIKLTKNKGNQHEANIDVDSEYPFSEKMDDPEIFAGEYFLTCFSTEKKKFDRLYEGCPIQVEGYLEDQKTKKKNFGKRMDRKMNMRLYHEGSCFGRVHDDEVRILMPLIDSNLIRAQYFIQDFPLFADLYKPITVRARIYFLPKLITEPIVENFQPNQIDKERVHEISGLLSKLNLPLLVEPLIKGKSKYIRIDKKTKNNKKESIDLMNFKKYQDYEQQKKRKMEDQVQNEMMRMKTDLNYRPVQKSIKDLMQGSRQTKPNVSGSTAETVQQINRKEQSDGLVQKKVIEIDTKAEKDKYSELIQLYEEDLQPFTPKSSLFVSELYTYQALALSWMLKREGYCQVKKQQEQIHPLWSQYEIPTCPKYRMFFNELTGQVCVRRPKSKIQCKGGILADEMGLGKTVMMAALIVSHQPQKKLTSSQGGTLVIVPLTLLSQWQQQLLKHTKGQKSLIYYSGQRKKYASSLHQYDVVISTYGTVSHEYAQGGHIHKTGIYKYKWHRIILDEAHYIKGRIIQTSKAVYELSGSHRWCLTGTPIQNTVADLFSLIHFIKYTPWSEFACWTRFISKPLQEGEDSIYGVLRTILKRVFLRRTKNSQDSNGKAIVSLPPRISKIQLLTMNTKQREFYDSVYSASKSDFDGLIDKGILEAKYMQVLEMLMRLRQICCHPILFKSITKFSKNIGEFESQLKRLIQKSRKKAIRPDESDDEYYEPVIDGDNEESRVKSTNPHKEIPQEYFRSIVDRVQNEDLDCCIICLNKPEDPVINCCLHIFCKSCNIRQIEEQGFCAYCRTPLAKDSFIYLPRQNRLNTKIDDIFLSTKMIALQQHLARLQKNDKVVVFSQFLGMLDLLENQFKKSSLKFVRMDGSDSHKQRTKIVNSFQNDPSVQIFLVSLKTAGVGLNLVAANKVFLLDPWWNPAVEEQAIERVHRIGQKRTVEIFRFIIDRTIQTRMLQLNTQKKQLSQNLLSFSKQQQNSLQKVEKLKYLMETY